MRILVIDDNATHCQVAQKLLGDHDLTVVGTYDEGQELLCSSEPFDAVLTDLMLPGSAKAQIPNSPLIGAEMPIGTTLAFLALRQGCKRIAVVTDTNHHDHPASAAFDIFRSEKDRGRNHVFSVGDARVLCTNSGNDVTLFDKNTLESIGYDFLFSPEGEEKYPYSRGTIQAKNWLKVLNQLMEEG